MATWIQPSGPRDAQVVVIGRDAGYEEIREGRGFVGASGKLLWHPTRRTGAADRVGLARERCLVTNVVNMQPANNDWSQHAPHDIERGSADALALITNAPRTLVVALGEQATSLCLTGRADEPLPDSITNIRGYVFTDTACGAPVLACVHPAFILRNWHPWWATFCWDWQKAARIINQGSYQEPIVTWGNGTSQEAGALLQEQPTCIAVDIETSGTGCVAFAGGPDYACVFPGKPERGHLHEAAIQLLLASPIPKVFQNGQFDVTMMERVGWRVNNWAYDTMLMWHALEPLLAGSQKDDSAKGRKKSGGKRTEKGLRFLASLLTNFPFWKDYEFADDTAQFELCARDACATWAIWNTLRDRLASA